MGAWTSRRLRRAFSENRYFIKLHAKERMSEKKVSDQDLGHVILAGKVIEVTPSAYPFPKALLVAEEPENLCTWRVPSTATSRTSLRSIGMIHRSGSMHEPGGYGEPATRKTLRCLRRDLDAAEHHSCPALG